MAETSVPVEQRPGGSWRPERRAARADLRHTTLLALVREVLDGAGPGAVVDIGGGTGDLSVDLALAGRRVVVVDPSPDALAALDRRAREAGVAHLVSGVQGDAVAADSLVRAALDEAAPPGGSAPAVAVVVCHDVLELVDDPPAAIAAMARCVGPGGVLSLLAAQRSGAAVARAAGGRLAEALAVLTDPAGRTGGSDPLSGRFDEPAVTGLLESAGFLVVSVTGVPAVANLVPDAVLDSGQRAREIIGRLEAEFAGRPDVRGIASHLHWHAVRG